MSIGTEAKPRNWPRLRQNGLYTTGMVAEMFGVVPRTVCSWMEAGELGGYRLPGSKDRRFTLESLRRFAVRHGMRVPGLTPIVVIHGATEDQAESIRQALGEHADLHVAASPAAVVVDSARLGASLIVLETGCGTDSTGALVRLIPSSLGPIMTYGPCPNGVEGVRHLGLIAPPLLAVAIVSALVEHGGRP